MLLLINKPSSNCALAHFFPLIYDREITCLILFVRTVWESEKKECGLRVLFTTHNFLMPWAWILTASKSFKFHFGCFHSRATHDSFNMFRFFFFFFCESDHDCYCLIYFLFVLVFCYLYFFLVGWRTTGDHVLRGGEYGYAYASSAYPYATDAAPGWTRR